MTYGPSADEGAMLGAIVLLCWPEVPVVVLVEDVC